MNAHPQDSSMLLAAGTLLSSAADGNIDATGSAVRASEGLYVGDTRLLSRWLLSLPGHPTAVGACLEGSSTRQLALLPPSPRNEPPGLLVLRTQTVLSDGLLERLTIRNTSSQPAEVGIAIEVEADFADQFALRSDGKAFDLSAAQRSSSIDASGALVFGYRHERADVVFEAGVRIHASIQPEHHRTRLNSATLRWDIALAPGTEQTLDLAATRTGPQPKAKTSLPLRGGHQKTAAHQPTLRQKSLNDLAALCMPAPGHPELTIPAAGVPWFLTLFGRDALITALLARAERPALLPNVLQALAATQGTRYDSTRGEQPGKIVHEIRTSELAALGMVPYARYYGTVDATPLFLMALGAVEDTDLLRRLEPAARAAVSWLGADGGLTRRGFVTYEPDPKGLINQGWKDSHDAVASADGTHPEGPIALCEAQGYSWRGLTETARLARTVWNDSGWAEELERLAENLRASFKEAFWMPEHDFPALALDGQGHRVDALASNAGHLLWTGILDQEEAKAVTERLMQPDFFTGWGVRTLAAGQTLFHPMSYHNGSVWPHDTIIAAQGMADYALYAPARQLAAGIRDAAAFFGNRLPELFGGFAKEDFPAPVSYNRAGTPQAWACAAGLAAERLAER